MILGFAGLPAFAQEPVADPSADTLVACGVEKVAVFGETTSPDGRFTVGWTLRPHRKKAPVDWSVYRLEDLTAMYKNYPIDFTDSAQGDYVFVDGVLDLRAKTSTPLPPMSRTIHATPTTR